jgi:hypothetical protein
MPLEQCACRTEIAHVGLRVLMLGGNQLAQRPRPLELQADRSGLPPGREAEHMRPALGADDHEPGVGGAAVGLAAATEGETETRVGEHPVHRVGGQGRVRRHPVGPDGFRLPTEEGGRFVFAVVAQPVTEPAGRARGGGDHLTSEESLRPLRA